MNRRDVRRMTNVVSRAITGPQINSSSKFIIHLPSASCHKACNMTPLKFVLTCTPGGVELSPPLTHTPSSLSLLMEQAGPLMLKRLQLSVSRSRGGPPLGVIYCSLLTLFHSEISLHPQPLSLLY